MSEQRLNYMKLAPEGVAALRQLEHHNNTGTALRQSLRDLVRLRVSQLNGCRFCMGMHTWELQQHHEPDTRIAAVAHWRTSDAFTERERAALAWAELLTRLNGNPGGDGNAPEPISDAEYAAARQHFDEKELVDLSLVIAAINAWNRMGVAFRPQWHAPGSAAAPAQPTEVK